MTLFPGGNFELTLLCLYGNSALSSTLHICLDVTPLYWGYLEFTAWMEWFLIWTLLRLGHHHLAELVKVHGAGAVLIKLLKDAFQLIRGEGGQQLADEASECFCCDVTQALLVIDPVK